MQKHENLMKVNISKEMSNKENIFWLHSCISPEDVAAEFEAFNDKPIPQEMDSYTLKPNCCVFEVFAINVNKYKDREAEKSFEKNKSAGIIPLDAKRPKLLFTEDSSGNINSEWIFLPIAKVLKISSSGEEYNPLGIKDGDYVRLSDSLAWRAENPVYKKFLSDHPYPEAIGLTQVTATPQQFIYNMVEGNGGLARDAFNVNPFTNKWYGLVFMKLVTEFTSKLSHEDIKDMLKIAAEPQTIIL